MKRPYRHSTDNELAQLVYDIEQSLELGTANDAYLQQQLAYAEAEIAEREFEDY